MRITCQLEEIDEKIAQLMESIDYIDEFEVEADEDSKIIAYNYKVLLPSLNLYAREGTMLNYSEDEQDWCADFSLTLIYNMDDEYLYWEQDDIPITLHNFLNATNRPKQSIYDLECIIEIDDDELNNVGE